MLSLRALARSEMQTASSKIEIWVGDSISFYDNRYAKHASDTTKCLMFHTVRIFTATAVYSWRQ